jgi:GT2 family glycosyltransferase
MKKAALICVTRNNAAKLRATLESIRRFTNPDLFDLFVIDNGSSDDTLAMYHEPLPEHVCMVRSGKNLHWVGAVNFALQMTGGYTYVGLLNDDIEVCPGWLENFFDVLDCNADVAAVGPVCSHERDAQSYDRMRRDYPQLGWDPLPGVDRLDSAAMRRALEGAGPGIKITGMIAFFCVLLRRSVVDAVGGLSPEFTHLYCGDDDDYCDRIRALGHGLAVSFRTYVLHHSGSSSSMLPEQKARYEMAAAIIAKKRELRRHLPVLQS